MDGLYYDNVASGNEYFLSLQNETRNWRKYHDEHLEKAKNEVIEEVNEAKEEIVDEIGDAKAAINNNINNAKSELKREISTVEEKVDVVSEEIGKATDDVEANTIFGKINKILNRWF